MARTATGIEFQVLCDNYGEVFAQNANTIQAEILVPWDDAADLRTDFLGTTEVDRGGVTPKLKRTLPYLCPTTSTKRAISMKLVGYGSDGTNQDDLIDPADINALNPIYTIPDEFKDTDDDGWWKTSHCRYAVEFARPPWRDTRTDEEASAHSLKELSRYVTRKDQFSLRELRRPDFGFESVEPPVITIPFVGFIPDVEVTLIYVWHQIPVDAIPFTKIKSLALHFNETVFDENYAIGQVLFKGVRNLDRLYEAAGSGTDLFVDIEYEFGRKFHHWNQVKRADSSLATLRRKKVSPDTPPYSGGELADLFVPE